MIFRKLGHRKDIVKGTFTILVISLLQPATNFLLLPVFTKFLDTRSYGYFSILNNISLFFSIISGLNIASAIAAHYKSFTTPTALKLFIGNTISFSVLFNTALLLIICLFGTPFANLIFKEHINFFPDVFLAIAVGLFSSIFILFGYYLRYDKQITRFSILSVLQILLLVGSQLLSLYFTKLGVTGIMWARFFSAMGIFIVILAIHRKYSFKRIRFRENLQKPLKYSIMTGPAFLIVWLTTYGDRFVLEHFMDLKSVGQYSFLVTICSVSELAIFALNSAFQPYIFDRFAVNPEYAKNFYKIFMVLCLAGLSALIVLCSNIDIFINNNEFLTTLPFTIPMVTAFVFSAVSNLYALQITFAQKGSYYLILSVIVLLSNIGLNFLLIPGNGIRGAIAANIITKVVMTITVMYLSKKAFYISNIKQTAAMVIFFLGVEYLIWSMGVFHLVNFRMAGFLQFGVLLSCIFIFYRKELRAFPIFSKQIT